MRALGLLALALLAACRGDETLYRYGAADKVWQLQEMGGTPIKTQASLRFGKDGTVTGRAPCNSFAARQSLPYPWFKLDEIAATKMACAGLNEERVFFDTLREMSLAEIAGNTLILSNDAGAQMIFTAE